MAIKLFCKILVQKYYVVGIKTVAVYVAIKCIKRRVFFLRAVRKIVSQNVFLQITRFNKICLGTLNTYRKKNFTANFQIFLFL